MADVLVGGEGSFGMLILPGSFWMTRIPHRMSADVNVKVGSLKFAIHDSKHERPIAARRKVKAVRKCLRIQVLTFLCLALPRLLPTRGNGV